MASLFLQVFRCCIRSKSPDEEESDERTHLIRPDDVNPGQTHVVDQKKMRRRLGSIVRAKEGKMVNVNNPLPFDLHNKALQARLDQSSSRSDRSVSDPHDPNRAVSGDLADGNGDNRAPYSPAGQERDSSPSLQTSHSTTSLHPGDASYLPPEADPNGGNKRPILNLRLVRPEDEVAGGRPGRGPLRGRKERIAEGRSRFSTELEPSSANGPSAEALANTSSTSSPTVKSPGSPFPPTGEPTSGSEHSTPHATEFQIQDVGKISCSWGD